SATRTAPPTASPTASRSATDTATVTNAGPFAAWPNPASRGTTSSIHLRGIDPVETVSVYDLRADRVASFTAGVDPAWDLRAGPRIARGVYLIRAGRQAIR